MTMKNIYNKVSSLEGEIKKIVSKTIATGTKDDIGTAISGTYDKTFNTSMTRNFDIDNNVNKTIKSITNCVPDVIDTKLKLSANADSQYMQILKSIESGKDTPSYSSYSYPILPYFLILKNGKIINFEYDYLNGKYTNEYYMYSNTLQLEKHGVNEFSDHTDFLTKLNISESDVVGPNIINSFTSDSGSYTYTYIENMASSKYIINGLMGDVIYDIRDPKNVINPIENKLNGRETYIFSDTNIEDVILYDNLDYSIILSGESKLYILEKAHNKIINIDNTTVLYIVVLEGYYNANSPDYVSYPRFTICDNNIIYSADGYNTYITDLSLIRYTLDKSHQKDITSKLIKQPSSYSKTYHANSNYFISLTSNDIIEIYDKYLNYINCISLIDFNLSKQIDSVFIDSNNVIHCFGVSKYTTDYMVYSSFDIYGIGGKQKTHSLSSEIRKNISLQTNNATNTYKIVEVDNCKYIVVQFKLGYIFIIYNYGEKIKDFCLFPQISDMPIYNLSKSCIDGGSIGARGRQLLYNTNIKTNNLVFTVYYPIIKRLYTFNISDIMNSDSSAIVNTLTGGTNVLYLSTNFITNNTHKNCIEMESSFKYSNGFISSDVSFMTTTSGSAKFTINVKDVRMQYPKVNLYSSDTSILGHPLYITTSENNYHRLLIFKIYKFMIKELFENCTIILKNSKIDIPYNMDVYYIIDSCWSESFRYPHTSSELDRNDSGYRSIGNCNITISNLNNDSCIIFNRKDIVQGLSYVIARYFQHKWYNNEKYTRPMTDISWDIYPKLYISPYNFGFDMKRFNNYIYEHNSPLLLESVDKSYYNKFNITTPTTDESKIKLIKILKQINSNKSTKTSLIINENIKLTCDGSNRLTLTVKGSNTISVSIPRPVNSIYKLSPNEVLLQCANNSILYSLDLTTLGVSLMQLNTSILSASKTIDYAINMSDTHILISFYNGSNKSREVYLVKRPNGTSQTNYVTNLVYSYILSPEASEKYTESKVYVDGNTLYVIDIFTITSGQDPDYSVSTVDLSPFLY